MKFAIELHPAAQQELSEAFQWYQERSPGLGERFIEAVSERFNELQIILSGMLNDNGSFVPCQQKYFLT